MSSPTKIFFLSFILIFMVIQPVTAIATNQDAGEKFYLVRPEKCAIQSAAL